MAAAEELAPSWSRNEKRSAGIRSGGSSAGVKTGLPKVEKKPMTGGLRWYVRKRRRNAASATRLRQRLQTRETRGRVDGFGGRRSRISRRRSSSSKGSADDGEVRRRLIGLVLDLCDAPSVLPRGLGWISMAWCFRACRLIRL
jgi:hypothetical protein